MVRYHRYSRIFCNGSVILSQQEKCWNSNIRDFSLNGLVVRKPSEWENEDNCDFLATLKLMGSDKDFVLELDLVEESPNSLSFHINHIDMENAAYLEQLSEKNVGNNFLLRRRLNQLHHRGINKHHFKK